MGSSIPRPGNPGFQVAPEAQTAIVTGFLGFLTQLIMGLINRKNTNVIVPAVERPAVEDLPDDKIMPAPSVKPSPHAAPSGYTGMKIGVAKAQYNREMFPDQYTKDNPFGLYRPARVDVYNRNSKIWFDSSPLKGNHVVQHDEGEVDGILWAVEYHLFYEGRETIVKAGGPDPERPGEMIQIVEGDSVGCGVTAWRSTQGYVIQIQVGENQGSYRVYAAIPSLGIRTEDIRFEVS